MRLSESLRRNVMKVGVGGIVNRFKAKERRDVLFFEDILANYIKECEDAGYGKEMEEVGGKWMNLVLNYLLPDALKKLPIAFLFNHIAKKIWINIGLMGDLKVEKEDNIITIKSISEHTTRIIGENKFMVSAWASIIKTVTNSDVKIIDVDQTRTSCTYKISIIDKSWEGAEAKESGQYFKLNYFDKKSGFTMKDACKLGIFQLKANNRIYFRGKSLIPIENTLFHLLSIKKVMLYNLSKISYEYFVGLVDKKSTKEMKLKLLKNILQSTGWGVVKIALTKGILVKIENPPYGLQKDKDDWSFLIHVVFGYIMMIDRRYKMKRVTESYQSIEILYER